MSIIRPKRSDPFVREVIRSWRSLTGGRARSDADRPTLVACSGGADSTALALALAATSAQIDVAYIRHDMRDAAEVERDEAHVRAVAKALDRPFHVGEARSGPGNQEASLRRGRYNSLGRIAEANGCAFVATGHHADDQVETILMRLARGAGPLGLRGVLPIRPLSALVAVVRPMLGVRHHDAIALCDRSGVSWLEDPTNADADRRRSDLRLNVLPSLFRVFPDAPGAIAASARAQADAARVVADIAASLGELAEETEDGYRWPREVLAEVRPIVLGELARALVPMPLRGRRYRDFEALAEALAADRSRDRVVNAGGLRWRVSARSVWATPIDRTARPG